MMTMQQHDPLLDEIEGFLAETGMGASYFGKAAVGNSELVPRLRLNRSVLTTTATRAREFIAARRRAGDKAGVAE